MLIAETRNRGNLQQRWAVNDTDQKRSIYLVKSVEYQPERVVGFNNRFAWRRWRIVIAYIIVLPRVAGKTDTVPDMKPLHFHIIGQAEVD